MFKEEKNGGVQEKTAEASAEIGEGMKNQNERGNGGNTKACTKEVFVRCGHDQRGEF